VKGNVFNQNEGKVVNGVIDQVYGSLNANLNIFNGLSQFNRVRQYTNALDAQAYYVNRTAQDIINTVTGQYLTVLLDAELLKIAQKNFEVLNNQLTQVKEQVELGAKGPVDGYNQDSQTKAAEILMVQAEIQLMNDKALLTLTLLMDPNEQFDVVKPAWDVNGLSDETELQGLFDTALKNRGDYLRAKKNEAASKYAMKAAIGVMTPTLSAFGQVYSTYNNVHGDENASFVTQIKTDNLKKLYGLSLYIPILGGNTVYQNRTAYVQQKVLYHNNQIATKNAEITVKTDVLRAFQNYRLYKKTFSLSVEQLTAAEQAFNLEKERYELGVTSFVDYITANRNLVKAQTDRAQAEYKLMFQKVVMDYAAGTLKPESIEY
jgi:outer membrane protein